MKVQLIDYTGHGHFNEARRAAEVMIFTKQTRLEMSPELMSQIEAWPDGKIMAELEYMANTIPSSWEFCDYTFLITGVTRAYTHQQVRTRTASFAQQTMRVLNVNGWTYGTGPSIEANEKLKWNYDVAMRSIDDAYRWLIENGAKIEDARGILPTNIHTNIVAKFNLRTFADMVRKRTSSRTQGEYREVMDAMKAEVLRVHPWSELFFNRTGETALNELEQLVEDCARDSELRLKMIKLIDQVRGIL